MNNNNNNVNYPQYPNQQFGNQFNQAIPAREQMINMNGQLPFQNNFIPQQNIPYQQYSGQFNYQGQYCPQMNPQFPQQYYQPQQFYPQPQQFQQMGYPSHLTNYNFNGFSFVNRPQISKDQIKKYAKKLFKQFTFSTGGRLFYNQLYPYLLQLTQMVGTTPATQQQCDYLFYSHDIDKSGYLCFYEIKRLIKHLIGYKQYSHEYLKRKKQKIKFLGMKFKYQIFQ